jgi:cytoskeletal protein CcmA (bactofilin family)
MAEDKGSYPTTIGADAVFKGQLQFDKSVRLLGRFEGEINSKGELVIAEGAKLTGEVKADTICVNGEVQGNLNAASRVQLSGSARLEGDLETTRLEVADGAVLVGRVSVGLNSKAGAAEGAKAGPVITAPVTPTTGKAKADQPTPAGARK